MFPFVKTFNASSPLNFHREDIKAIQTLYGEKTGGVDLSIAQEAASEKQNPSFGKVIVSPLGMRHLVFARAVCGRWVFRCGQRRPLVIPLYAG